MTVSDFLLQTDECVCVRVCECVCVSVCECAIAIQILILDNDGIKMQCVYVRLWVFARVLLPSICYPVSTGVGTQSHFADGLSDDGLSDDAFLTTVVSDDRGFRRPWFPTTDWR